MYNQVSRTGITQGIVQKAALIHHPPSINYKRLGFILLSDNRANYSRRLGEGDMHIF